MRVGILAPTSSESLGGGHTFEEEIFERILEAAPSTRHEFVIFESGRGGARQKRRTGFQYVPLKRPLPTKLRSNARSRIHGLMQKPILRNFNMWEEAWVSRLITSNQIDFFLNIKPGTITRDIPFLTLVWDLQHRLQPYFPEVSADGQWEAREYVYSHVLPRATFVIAGTEAGKKEIETFYDVAQERIRILPHPTPRFALEASAPNTDELASYRLPPNYVFYPAQFWPHKNHVGLLRAVDYLRREHKISLPVVFVGSDHGNKSHVQSEARKLGLEEQVFFLGHVSRAALCALYQNAFALCYVSFFGPENLPPLEAFALGCPVIAADVPGSNEQLGNAALRIDPSNEVEIANALRLLLRDPAKRAELIACGEKRARRFTGTDFARGLVALLDEFETLRRCWK